MGVKYLKMRSIKVFAPATVANVVCGFDVLGFAVHEPGDEVEMQLTGKPGVVLKKIEGDGGLLPLDPLKNTASSAVIDFLNQTGNENTGIEISLNKKMPIGSGLGSSAASTVAGLFAINELLDRPLTKEKLLTFALAGEQLACGQGHADNVAPSLMGGFVLIRSYDPLDVITLPTPDKLVCTLIHPHIEIQTRDARKIIRHQVPLKDAVTQWGNIAGLVSGLYREDYSLISRSMKDVIIEPSRAILIPDFYVLKEKALAAGALGFGISGSGPSVFALSQDAQTAEKIKEVIQNHLFQKEITSDGFVSAINKEGPQVIG